MKLFFNEPIFFHLIHSCFKLYFGFRDGTRRFPFFFFLYRVVWSRSKITGSGKWASSLWSRNSWRILNRRNDDSLSFHRHVVISILISISLSSEIEKFLNLMCTFLANHPSLDSLLPFHEIPKPRPPSNDTCTAWNVSLNSLTYTFLLNSRENGSRQDQSLFPRSPVVDVSLYPLHRLEGGRGAVARRFAGPRSSTIVSPPRVG